MSGLTEYCPVLWDSHAQVSNTGIDCHLTIVAREQRSTKLDFLPCLTLSVSLLLQIMGLALRRKNWLRKELLSRKISERKLNCCIVNGCNVFLLHFAWEIGTIGWWSPHACPALTAELCYQNAPLRKTSAIPLQLSFWVFFWIPFVVIVAHSSSTFQISINNVKRKTNMTSKNINYSLTRSLDDITHHATPTS